MLTKEERSADALANLTVGGDDPGSSGNILHSRELIAQMGAYGEHHSTSISLRDRNISADSPLFRVCLAPGAGASMTVRMNRFAHTPSLAFPWDR